QRDLHCRTVTGSALYFNYAAVIHDNALRNVQPKPRSALSLRGEEWLEDVVLYLFRNADAVIDYLDGGCVMLLPVFDPDLAAMRKRIDRIEDQIRHHLAQF